MSIVNWMRGGYGIMCHYLSHPPGSDVDYAPSADEWNSTVESVDAEALADTIASTGARWLIFTIGQISGYYCSPNATLEQLIGRSPSRLSRRDLVAELAASLRTRGMRTIAYLPSHAPSRDRVAVEALDCTPEWDASHWQLKPGSYLRTKETDERLSKFQRNWESVVQEWSTRWGEAISGWWIDGCYYGERMYQHPDEPNLESFARALKAGNPDAVVAFNPGVMIKCYGAAEDFTAGESMHNLTVAQWEGGFSPLKNPTGNSQLHVLLPLGKNWCQGEQPRFNQNLVIGYSEYITSLGGGISWDVPITPEGAIPRPFIRTLSAVGRALR